MKPTIYEAFTSAGRMAWLVDESAPFLAHHEGVRCKHYTAIEMSELQAGELREAIHPETGERTISGPRCCVLAVAIFREGAKLRKNGVESRGLTPQAASVLLELAAASNDVSTRPARMTWDFCGPAEKGVSQPWDDLKFLAAWRWSYWKHEKLTGKQRHADMVALGYPYSYGTLRHMLSKMRLVKPRPGAK